jgi:sec-independent protein translocase protein TatA
MTPLSPPGTPLADWEAMGELQPTHILLVLAVVLLLFGGSRIANVGKALGEGIRNFKAGIKSSDDKA